jgi:hypothetical protein
MSDITIHLRDARRQRLDDIADVIVTSHRTNTTVASRKGVKGSTSIRVTGLSPGAVYAVRAFPLRHRPVGHFVIAPASGTRAVELHCPVDPERVESVTFPPFASLPPPAQEVLQNSTLEHPPQNVSGQGLYEAPQLSDVARAGLLNVLAKMAATPLPDGSVVLDHVQSLFRIRGDRLFGDVALGLRDLVKTAVDEKRFKPADDSLHAPPPGFDRAGSFKTLDLYGNLQVTFFSSLAPPLRFKADVDIDDAAGLEHAFQVLGHWLTGEKTHPYDIQQILLFHQGLDPGYELLP